MKKSQTVRCEICGFEEARIRHVNRSYGRGADILVIDGVPVVSCPTCGESYLTADTIREVERLKLQRPSVRTAQWRP